MKHLLAVFIFLITLIVIGIESCQKPDVLSEEDYSEWYSGGVKGTTFDGSSRAFGMMLPGLSENKAFIHDIGDAAFEATFVSDVNAKNHGLGTIFNNVSCRSCHVADGRGKAPTNASEALSSMLIRISVPGEDEYGGPNPAPGFGVQLQPRAITGFKPEADVSISYTEETYKFADGEYCSLRTPAINLSNPYTALPSNTLLSGRIAPPIFGLGLLEAIPENDILMHADPDDANGDGISGKPNYVWDAQKKQKALGRFGWKASNPTILQQSAGAYNQDMGITNYLFPVENNYGQFQYQQTDKNYQVTDSLMLAVTFYMKTLAVPARRYINTPEVKMGKQIFKDAACSNCHQPMMRTAVNVAFPELSNQVIFPYTDLLLHDMGPGLADNRPDYQADGREWKTPPLWGIGLTRKVNGHENFMHDGRARNFTEAIMWHGGEAEKSKIYFYNLSKDKRDALISFLGSL